jgi:hypothetical protein
MSIDPYAPPASAIAPAPAPRGAWIKWTYLGSVATAVGTLVVAGAVPAARVVVPLVLPVLLVLPPAVGMVWLGIAWAGVPDDELPRGMGVDPVSPAGAVGRLFIPIYALYWAFAVHVHLCGGIRRGFRRRARPAPRWLGGSPPSCRSSP